MTGQQPFFQSEFSTDRNPVLPLSNFSILSLRSFSSCLRILPCLPVTSILPSIFPSIMCFRSQFLCKMCPIQSAFLPCILHRIFLSYLTMCNTSSFLTWSMQLIFSILLQHHISELSRYSSSIFQSVRFSASQCCT